MPQASLRSWTLAITAQACGAVLIAGPAAAVPPPQNWGAATTNCAGSPVYAIDSMVCEDLELAHLNAALAARIAAPGDVAGLTVSHDEWYRASRMCAKRLDAKVCILNAYLERLRALGPIADSPEGDTRTR